MKENPFHIIPKILAAAAGFLAVVMVFAFAFEAFAFVGPSQAPTNGSGAIGSDASNNVSVGTPTTIPGTKLVVIGASSDNTTNAAQFLENNNTPIFILRDDGSISIATTTITAGTTIIGGNLTIGGTVTAPNLSSFIGANLVTSGEFGDGNGNYTFGGTSNVYFPGSGIWNSSGNVGIGTTNPGSKLEVNGIISTTDAGTLTGDINAGAAGVYSFNGSGRYVRFNTNGGTNDLLSYGSALAVNYSGGQNVNFFGGTPANLTVNGNVGIGTTNPGYALDVNGHANALGYCINGSNCITSWPSGGTSQWTTNGSNIYYNSGNVGIGTTSPGANLVVQGAANTGSAGTLNIIATGDANNTNLIGAFQPSLATGHENWMNWGVSGSAGDAASLGYYYAGNNSASNRFDFAVWGAATPQLSMLNNGNVGIGTINPGYTLDVNGTARATTLIDSGLTSQNCIGTNSLGQLQGGTCGATGALTGSGTANVMAMFTGAGVIGNSSPVITESGTSGGTVSIAGNVGIGTTNPSVKLDVAGGINLEANGSNDAPLQVGYTSASPAGYYATYAP
jgi:hypothetical protein